MGRRRDFQNIIALSDRPTGYLSHLHIISALSPEEAFVVKTMS